MANNSKKNNNNKGIIIGCICAVVVIVAIIIAVVVANNNRLGDAYFQSDGTKYVLNMEFEPSDDEGDVYVPLKSHTVYNYQGDAITGVKIYYEYANEDKAKAAYDYFSANTDDSVKSVTRDGKYVILESSESEYQDLKAADVKSQIDFIESLKNVKTSTDGDNVETTETTEVEATETEATDNAE